MDNTRQSQSTNAGDNGPRSEYTQESNRILRSGIEEAYAERIQMAGFVEIAKAAGDSRQRGIARASNAIGGPSVVPGLGLQQVWRQKLINLDPGEHPNAVLRQDDLRCATRIAIQMAREHPIELGDSAQQTYLAEVIRAQLPYWNFSHARLEALWHLGRMAAFHIARNKLQKAVEKHRRGICRIPLYNQTEIIARAVRLSFPYTPRKQQIEAIRHLVFDQADLILIAPTSFGKSTILQAFSLLLDCVTLVILPLNRIGKEQEAKIRKLGGNPLAINADRKNNLTPEEKGRLRQGQYTHLMMSPEAAISPWFRDLLARPELQQRIGLVVVDEFHLVDQWGKAFRKEYGKLRFLRGCLSAYVPWFACSATLDPLTLIEARIGAGFQQNTRIIRTPIDRPEIFLRVATIPENTINSFDALFHIVQPCWNLQTSVYTPLLIPKTVIFTETRGSCGAIAEALKAYLHQVSKARIPQERLDTLIKVYHGRTGQYSQDRIIDGFNSGLEIRIVVATEALGLGVDVESIEHVYQYGFPQFQHLAVLWQRAGRACRGPRAGRGCFTLLIPSSVLKSELRDNGAIQQYWNKVLERVKQQGGDSQSSRGSKKFDKQKAPSTKKPPHAKQAEVEAKKKEEDEKEIKAINSHITRKFATTKECRRQAILEFLEEGGLSGYRFPEPSVCCDNCSKRYLQVYAATPTNQHTQYSRTRTEIYMHFLVEWEWSIAKQVFQYSVFPALPGCLFSHPLLEEIARDQSLYTFRTITTETELANFIARHENGPRALEHVRKLWHVVYQLDKLAQDKIAVENAVSNARARPTGEFSQQVRTRDLSPASSMSIDGPFESIATAISSPVSSSQLKRRRVDTPELLRIQSNDSMSPVATAARVPLAERNPNIVATSVGVATSRPSTPSYCSTPRSLTIPAQSPFSPYTILRSGRSAVRSRRWLDSNR